MNSQRHLFWAVAIAVSLVGCGSDSENNPAGSIISADDISAEENSAADNLDQDLASSQPSDIGCSDLFSFNDNWADNCVLKSNGLYAYSNFSYGVQRILWCLGYADDDSPDLLDGDLVHSVQFVSGRFDETTEAAVRRYQSVRRVQAHGAVGETTWKLFRQELSLLGAAAAEYSSYYIDSERCENIPYFFQRNSEPYDWRMVSSTNENEQVEFTVIEPTTSVD